MRKLTVTDSEPLFIQMNLVNGHEPRVWPSSRSRRSANRFWLNDGVMTFAITQFPDIAAMTPSGP